MPGKWQVLQKRCHYCLQCILNFVHSAYTNEHPQALPSQSCFSKSPKVPYILLGQQQNTSYVKHQGSGQEEARILCSEGVTSFLKTFWPPGFSFSSLSLIPLGSVTISLEGGSSGSSCSPCHPLLTVDAHHSGRPERRGEVKLFSWLLSPTVKIPGSLLLVVP